MAHLSRRLLAIAVLAALAAVMSVEANAPKNPTWCVANDHATNDELQPIIDSLCNEVDCAPIKPHGHCYLPNTKQHHASWAMNKKYHATGAHDCTFGGHGMVVYTFPENKLGCKTHQSSPSQHQSHPNPPSHAGNTHSNPRWCIAKHNLHENDYQDIIHSLCGHQVNCKETEPNGACYKPNSPWSHASWAMNQYYKLNGGKHGACDHKGRGFVTQHSPGSAHCFPHVTGPAPTGGHGRGTQEL